jgi:hypothetical protein
MQEKMNLAAKIASVSGELVAIPKVKHKESTVAYAFRSIDEVMNAINPLLEKYKLVISIKVIDRKVTPVTSGKGTPGFAAEVLIDLNVTDGIETLTTQEWALSVDYSDKAPTQAMSMAYKYALIRMFVVTTKDIIANDADMRDVEIGTVKEAAKKPANNLEYLKNTFLAELNSHGLQAEFAAKVREYQNEKFLFWKNAINKQEALSIIITELKRLRGDTD